MRFSSSRVVLEAEDLAAQPAELAAQALDIISVIVVWLGRGPNRRRRHPSSDRDPLVGRPLLLPRRARIAGPLNTQIGRASCRDREVMCGLAGRQEDKTWRSVYQVGGEGVSRWH